MPAKKKEVSGNKDARKAKGSNLLSYAQTSEEGLVEYEKYAIKGICEMLPKWYEEAGFGGMLRSLMEAIVQADTEAGEVGENDDELMSKQRYAAAKHFRMLTMLSRPEIQDAIELLQKEHEQKALG